MMTRDKDCPAKDSDRCRQRVRRSDTANAAKTGIISAIEHGQFTPASSNLKLVLIEAAICN